MLQQSRPQELGKTRLLRRVLIGVAALGLVLCLAGALAWYFAAQAATGALDAMIAQEAAHGRVWTCPDRRIGGFPLSIEVACQGPSYAGLLSGEPTSVRAKALRASVPLLHPNEVTAEIEAPFTLRSQDGRTEITAAWTSLRIVATGVPAEVSEISFRGQGLAAQGHDPALGSVAFQAAGFDGVIGTSARGTPQAVDFRLAAQQVVNPLIASALGSSQGVDLRARGTLTQAAFDPTRLPAENLENWRVRGGSLDFGDVGFVQDKTELSARGTLMLDAAHRLQGRLDTEAQGLEPILRRYGINPSLAAAGNLLSSLLGGGAPAPSTPSALRLPLRFDSGSVIVGPIKTGLHVPPLY